MTVGAALTQATNALTEFSDSARTDAVRLLERVIARSPAWMTAHAEDALSHEQRADFNRLCDARATGMPVAYLLQSAGFYGYEFFVNESVLVPRPETEHLAGEAIDFLRDRRNGGGAVLDVGTGSGAIACTIAAKTRASVAATDASPQALAIACENAQRLGVAERCTFYLGDLVAPVDGRRFDVVVANLPYVASTELPDRPNPIAFEPRIALDGGPDGLAIYRRLLPALPALLNHDALVLLEAAPPTIVNLAQLLRAALPAASVSLHDDYAGLARYVKARSEVPQATPAN